MKKTVPSLLCALCFLVVPLATATVNLNTEAVRKSVVYIYGGDNDGTKADQTKILGTGFIVGVPLVSSPDRAYYLLITARHVLDPAWAHCPEVSPEWVYLRMNTIKYDPKKDATGVGFVPLHLVLNQTWLHHSDDNVDVAVVLLNVKAFEHYDVKGIQLSDFATEEEAKQRVTSDPVVSAGLLLVYPGVQRNYPVFKFGYLSVQPDELIPSKCAHNSEPILTRLWLLSINLLPGNSGSPIFYVPEGANNVSFGGGRTNLIGLQSMSFLGFDVSGMTPMQYIFETIEAMKLPDADLYRGLVENKPKKASPAAQ